MTLARSSCPSISEHYIPLDENKIRDTVRRTFTDIRELLYEQLWVFNDMKQRSKIMERCKINFEKSKVLKMIEKTDLCLSGGIRECESIDKILDGTEILNDISLALQHVSQQIELLSSEKANHKIVQANAFSRIEKHTRKIICEMKMKIREVVEEIEQRVFNALHHSILKIDLVVAQVKIPFHEDKLVLNVYKRNLNSHLENFLKSHLRMQVNHKVHLALEAVMRDMKDAIFVFFENNKLPIPAEVQEPNEDFDLKFDFDCQNVFSDFQEDLVFKYSGSIPLIQWAVSKKTTKTNINVDIPLHLQGISNGSITILCSTFCHLFNSVNSLTTFRILILSGIIKKFFGWFPLICMTATIPTYHISKYFYERMCWTAVAKENAFKAQYACHSAKKLKLIADFVSTNCSHQVQQYLSVYFARLFGLVDNALKIMKDEFKALEEDCAELQAKENQLRLMRNKAKFLLNNLSAFAEEAVKRLH